MSQPEPRWTVDTDIRLKMADVLTAYTHAEPGPLLNDEAYDLTGPLLDVLADAGLLLPPGGEEREESRVVYADGRGQDVVWSSASTASAYSGETQLAVARKEGWPAARLQYRRITEWPDGTQRISDWIEVVATERTPQ